MAHPMRIPLNRQSQQPMYLQIQERLQSLIHSGSLPPGEKLPSIRGLAKTLQVNKLTVIEAYDRLVAEGLISARQGSGYFVDTAPIPDPARPCCFAPHQTVVVWESQANRPFALYARSIQAKQQPNLIDLSCAFPKDPPDDLARIIRRVSTDSDNFFDYNAIEGHTRLRHQIANLLLQVGLEASADDIMVVNGAMQGLSLAIRHFVKPGDWVIVESPTFFSALPIFQQLGCRIIGIPMDREGMNLDLLARYLDSHRPRLIFTTSTLHNPTGITTTATHRRQLLALASQYECPILEDNAYEVLHFGSPPPPLKVMDTEGWVTYVGTFSKTLSPGLRVGYLVVPPAHRQALLELRYLTDIHTPTLSQAVVSEFLAQGHYRRHLQRVHTQLHHNRNLMLRGLEQSFPDFARWTVPEGGMYLWVQLPDRYGPLMPRLIHQAEAHGILILSGSSFFPDGMGYPAMRLSYVNVAPELIEGAMSRLGSLVKNLDP
ncbi:MAG: PLP-dependent aminotransferase family protein [Cyanophyceae cyanobacterium]